MKQSQKVRPQQDLEEELLDRCKMLDALRRTEGFKLLKREIDLDIVNRYKRMATETKDEFDEHKGYLKGVNFVYNFLKSYDDKRKKLHTERKINNNLS